MAADELVKVIKCAPLSALGAARLRRAQSHTAAGRLGGGGCAQRGAQGGTHTAHTYMHTHMHTIVRGRLGRGAHGSLRVLDPENEPGRVTLITRYGSKKIRQYLPAHIKAVQAAGLKVGR